MLNQRLQQQVSRTPLTHPAPLLPTSHPHPALLAVTPLIHPSRQVADFEVREVSQELAAKVSMVRHIGHEVRNTPEDQISRWHPPRRLTVSSLDHAPLSGADPHAVEHCRRGC